MPKEYNIIAFHKTKTGERYVFLWDKTSTETLLKLFAKFAADPELSFSWLDAVELSNRAESLA